MRALRFLTLAAALIVPAAAAHAQIGIYVGPSHRFAAPVYGPGYGYIAPRPLARGPVAYGYGPGYYGPGAWTSWRGDHRYWEERRRWDRARWDHERRW